MEKRTLGKNLTVSALGLGCMGMSEFYGPRNDAHSLQVLRRAVDLGTTFFDTADMYGPHHNERLLGRFIAEHGRQKLVIATKFGIVRDNNPQSRSINNDPSYVRMSCEASLKRLGIDYIDLYYVHRYDPNQPLEPLMETLASLVDEGKIGYVGFSEVNAETLRRAHALYPITALQSEYSLWTRGVEAEILPTCAELGIGFVPYSPLGRGFLTGKILQRSAFAQDDFRNRLPRFSAENFEKNLALIHALENMAREKGCTTAQLALAWVLHQDTYLVPIPGTKHMGYLEENIASTQLTLSRDDCRLLEETALEFTPQGERYSALGMTLVET